MKKNGFTIIELLAVIVILGIISTIATLSVTKYRKNASEKELIVLRETLIDEFNNYRVDNSVLEGINIDIISSKDNRISNEGNLILDKDVSYNAKKCYNSTTSTDKSIIKYVKKGTIDNNSSKAEVFCVKFFCNNKLIIDDYKTSNYCK